MKMYFYMLMILLYLCMGCRKDSEMPDNLDVPEIKVPPISITKCGPVDSLHSMFVINGKCWGVNPPQVAIYDELKRIYCEFSVRNTFDEFLNISKNTLNNKKELQQTIWTLIFAYSEGGDGLLSGYFKKIDTDTTQSLIITYNADSTEISGKIKDLNLTGGGNLHLGFPREICISEGSFRMKVKR